MVAWHRQAVHLQLCTSGSSSHRRQRLGLFDPRAELIPEGFTFARAGGGLHSVPLFLGACSCTAAPFAGRICLQCYLFVSGFSHRSWAAGHSSAGCVIHRFLYTSEKMLARPRDASSQREKGNILLAVFLKRGPLGKLLVALLIASMPWVNLSVWSSRLTGY